MNEQIEVKVNLSSSNWDVRFPSARVYINDILIFDDLIIESKELSWSGELNEGKQIIAIEMYGKRPDDTITDSAGNIVDDVILNIDDVRLNNIAVESLLWSKSTYYPVDENSPDKVDNCVNLGWNGRWELDFETPVHVWFLENL